MKSKKALSAASYPSRIFKDDVTIKCPDCMVLCSGGCLTVAANSKNKETTTSLFFSRRQRSEVMFSLHENPRFGLSAKGETAPDGRSFRVTDPFIIALSANKNRKI